MKKILLGTFALLVFAMNAFAQGGNGNVRFIEVTGSAEMRVAPDEVRFQITIEEYWKEEFEEGKEYKDYVTLIPLDRIEGELMASLRKSGIKKDQIIVEDIGKYWSRPGKDFKKSKTIELILTDQKKVNEILLNTKVRGISSMQITELKNKDIAEYRKQVKIEAMKAAKEKASYLLESVDETLGGVISIVELDGGSSPYLWNTRAELSNTFLSANSTGSNDLSLKKIELQYKIKVQFEIK